MVHKDVPVAGHQDEEHGQQCVWEGGQVEAVLKLGLLAEHGDADGGEDNHDEEDECQNPGRGLHGIVEDIHDLAEVAPVLGDLDDAEQTEKTKDSERGQGLGGITDRRAYQNTKDRVTEYLNKGEKEGAVGEGSQVQP